MNATTSSTFHVATQAERDDIAEILHDFYASTAQDVDGYTQRILDRLGIQ